ncbi:uncharacterized protein Z518_09394 [Rhinocladiella mackenziei CBS 650.93]|uniref:Myb-like domain-containing protein n=1 Tax=Rhinocladiella mackenziei CBS 650.93 TaxID=1442369 RepID=A0A0D2GTL3_9EURO|nr:uncharacterized protein Z518_09394 [Rhinocladiella mackenziei CBS 650.93]KIX01668.1 hypothetical protein Z518_09394 [Rhinocladiella mackenziei CBS 650.93]
MTTTMAPALAAWPHNQPAHNVGWPEPHLQYPPQAMMQTYLQPIHTSSIAPHSARREPLPRPGQSSPWTAEEDNILLDAKSQGLAWEEIKIKHFPNKSGNACRKRHERLLAKARKTDWDEARVQKLVNCYSRCREQIWRQLSDQVGERWDEVEKVMFQQGLRGLRNPRPYHGRTRSRASSSQGGPGEYDDASSDEYENVNDSGISLGHAGHSRRASELGTLQQQSLPSVGHILSEAGGGGYSYTS